MLKGVRFDSRLQLRWQAGKFYIVLSAKGRAHGYVIQAIVGANALNVQYFVKAVAQAAHEG